MLFIVLGIILAACIGLVFFCKGIGIAWIVGIVVGGVDLLGLIILLICTLIGII